MSDTPRQDNRLVRFDAFLSHNSENKAETRQLKNLLAEAHLTAWLDEDELRPGIPWQKVLETAIRASKSIVVVVGKDGLGPWEDEEMAGALRLAVKNKRPVIPVLLPGCPAAPDLPMFLGNRTWVDFRTGFSKEGFERLRWGITGVKPESSAVSEKDDTPETPPEDVIGQPPSISGPLTLSQVLPGQWQVQVQAPYPPGGTAQLRLEISPNGIFSGQLVSLMGVLDVEGQWQADPLTNKIDLQGTQTNGLQILPYVALLQVTYFNQKQIRGFSNAGEQVAWQRV